MTFKGFSEVFAKHYSSYPDLENRHPYREAMDFYLLNHVYSETINKKHRCMPLTQNERVFESLYFSVVENIGVKAFYYLFLICFREMRHMKTATYNDHPLMNKAIKFYSSDTVNLLKNIVSMSSENIFEFLRNNHSEVQVIPLVAAVKFFFDNGKWSKGYGGKAWGRVTKCLLMFLQGDITFEMMVDTVWTLAHNNGPIFNKGYGYYKVKHLITVLDIQRSGQIPNMFFSHQHGVSYLGLGGSSVGLYERIKEKFGGVCPGVTGHLDWFLVESLGAEQQYTYYKNLQTDKHKIFSPGYSESKNKKITKDTKVIKNESQEMYQVMPGMHLPVIDRDLGVRNEVYKL
ncbi:MAG: hypothetical protein GWN00_01135 [Aliifodinibius sp.]|nr:hypothetical protein [Fodinibius sp.]NIY23465.1 hypothetical protein [Fodinibius sp.]